ncbi:hypothetical protein M0657_010969 [Pyricularia oryzae]|nr:hypothetical protein M9X92_010982 [Pyricularia oryzae]KAI7911406.1 hypothetical protein M0657_010969 [Pyricularia oryzae]
MVSCGTTQSSRCTVQTLLNGDVIYQLARLVHTADNPGPRYHFRIIRGLDSPPQPPRTIVDLNQGIFVSIHSFIAKP